MAEPTSFLGQFATEVRRRKVLRVVAAYAVTAWLLLQIAEVTFEPLGIAPWVFKTLIIASIVGLPVSVVLAWVIDLRKEGLVFDLPLWGSSQDDNGALKQNNLLRLGLLGFFLVGGTYAMFGFLSDVIPDGQETAPASTAPANSIAVLAFENFDGDNESSYFASGLAGEILNLLTKVEDLQVAARSSSFQFQGQQHDAREVARKLNVIHLLEGSVRRAGEEIRVSAQLIDGKSGFHDWSDVYERKLTDIFSIQEEIAAAVVNELRIAMSADSAQQLQYKPTSNISAYVYYLEGRGRLRQSSDADAMEAASQLFERALTLDPAFARAHAGICESRLRLYEIRSDKADFDTAQASCTRAGELDSGLNTDIKIALGTLYRYRGWYDRAEQQLNETIAMDPAAVDAYLELGQIREEQNRPGDAEALLLRAVDLKSNYWRVYETLANFYYRSGRYPDAINAYSVAISLAPDIATLHGGLGAAYAMSGDQQSALDAYKQSLALKPSRQAYTNMGLQLFYEGQFQAAADMQQKALEYAPDDHRVWGRLAESHRLQGNEEAAQRAYERAVELATAHLQVNSTDWRTQGLLAIYLVYLGNPGEALALAQAAVDASQRDPEALYYLGLTYLQAGNEAESLDALEEAVRSDEQYREFVASEPDLRKLSDSERFRQLLSRADQPSEPGLE